VESVLARWEKASQRCRTLDAKLTVFHYDAIFHGEYPTISRGRFYYEAPNVGRCEIRKGGNGKANDWSALPDVLIWTGKETLWIDGRKKQCQRFPSAQFRTLREMTEGKPPSFFEEVFSRIVRMERPQTLLPLAIDVRAADVRERFDVTIERNEDEIWLKAVPKQSADRTDYREIDVILNGKTWLTSAMRTISANGKDRVVFQFEDQKVNQRPIDRDELISPDLSGLTIGCVPTPMGH
jgi:TIGR03009 family protein